MAKTSSYLPPEIIEAILLKSLVKPLLRFKSVSKSWKALISDPLFVKNHHLTSKSSNSQDLFVCDSGFPRGFTSVKLSDQKFEIVQDLGNPDDYKDVICYCEGVILLTDRSYMNRKHVLWNPSAPTQTKFWIPYVCGGASYGLCHDPDTDDFKVVIVDRDYYSVYSCKHKALMIRKKNFIHPYTDFRRKHSDPGACVDGAVYWVWSYKNVERIVYYDPRDDKFKILQKPKNLEDSKMFFLADVGGFLCLRCEGKDETGIRIWIKEKGIGNSSWKDFVSIENVEMDICRFEPQCLVGNKIVIWGKHDHKLVAYSPLEKTFQQLGELNCHCIGRFPNLKVKCSCIRLVPYLDSSIFPVTPKGKRKRL